MIKYVKNAFKLKIEIDDITIKDVKTLSRLKKKIDDTTIKNIINLFSLKKESKSTKNSIITDIRKLFEQEEKYYYWLISTSK